MNNPQIGFVTFIGLCLLLFACQDDRINNLKSAKANNGNMASIYLDSADAETDIHKKINFLNYALRSVECKEDSLLPTILDYKIYYHEALNEQDSAWVYVDSLKQIAALQNDSAYLARAYYRSGKLFASRNDHENSYKNMYESQQLYIKLGDSGRVGSNAIDMANSQFRSGDYTGAQETGILGLKYLQKEKDSASIAKIHNTIASTYVQRGFYQDAIAEFEHALNYSSAEDSLGYLNNIALAKANLGDYKEASKIYERILKKVDANSEERFTLYKENYAYVQWKQDPNRNIEPILLNALNLQQNSGDLGGVLTTYEYLTDYYLKKDPVKAKGAAKNYLETAQVYGDKHNELLALKKILMLSPQSDISKYTQRYIKLNDSLNTAVLNSKNAFAKIKYDQNKKQEEIDDLAALNIQHQLESQHLHNRSIIIFLIALLLIVGFISVIYNLRQKHKKEKIKEAYRTELKISKVIHDELANDIYDVMSALEPIAETQLMSKLQNIYNKARDISRAHKEIDAGENFLNHLVATLITITPRNSKLIIKGENSVGWNKLEEEKKIIIYRVLQELMVNMKKHSEASLVAIGFEKDDKALNIQYSDNGVGHDLKAKQKSNGLLNVENRILSINGRVKFESEKGKGFKAKLKIPV